MHAYLCATVSLVQEQSDIDGLLNHGTLVQQLLNQLLS